MHTQRVFYSQAAEAGAGAEAEAARTPTARREGAAGAKQAVMRSPLLPPPCPPEESSPPRARAGGPAAHGGLRAREAEGPRLQRWLVSLGFELQTSLPKMRGTDAWGDDYGVLGSAAVLHDFTDGVLLCDLVSVLLHTELRGVTRSCRSPASCGHNIEKALRVLRDEGRMPATFLWCNAEVARGDARVILGLLGQLKRVYWAVAKVEPARTHAGRHAHRGSRGPHAPPRRPRQPQQK